MNKLNVAILEPMEDFHVELGKHYRLFFEAAGYEAHIVCVRNERELNNQLRNSMIEVVVADLSLSAPIEDSAGLLVVQSLKRNHPEVLCIGMSRHEVSYRQSASKWPTFDMFIAKEGLLSGDKVYLKHLLDEFLSKFKCNTEIEIDDASELGEELGKVSLRKEMLRLLAQVTFSGHNQDPLINGKRILLTPLSGGRSASHVFKMTAKNSVSSISAVPAVLKISDREFALQEYDNYNRFVKWVLPYSWRVDLLGTGFTKSLGAICYSFILSGNAEFDSLTRFIGDGDKEAVERALKMIFDPGMKQWYSDELIRDEENINQRYVNRYLLNGAASEKVAHVFATSCQEIFQDTVITRSDVRVFGKRYALPVDRLFGEPNGPYKSCICHGDLNSNNVMLAENGHVIFIDFQHTGRGHVFEDFITMEASIRLYYGSSIVDNRIMTWQEVIEYESLIGNRDAYDSLPLEYQLISDVREMARANFPKERWGNYYYGVAAFNCRLLRIPDLSLKHKGKVLSAILVGLEKLDASK